MYPVIKENKNKESNEANDFHLRDFAYFCCHFLSNIKAICSPHILYSCEIYIIKFAYKINLEIVFHPDFIQHK